MRHEIYSWLPPDPPMSGTIQLYHSELPVHTFALGICRVTIRLLHSSALVLMEHPICSTGGVFEERVEYITSTNVLGPNPVTTAAFSSCNAKVKSVECHLHALMCSVTDNPPSCE